MKKLIIVWMLLLSSLVHSENNNNETCIIEYVGNPVYTYNLTDIVLFSQASNCWEDVLFTNTPIGMIDYVKKDGFLTNVIEELGKQGEICKIYGHQWKHGYSNDGTETRRCKICDIKQVQKWE